MNDNWKLTQTLFDKKSNGYFESVFSLGNGNLGFRGTLEERESVVSPGTFINGFYETVPICYGESAYGFPENNQIMLSLPETKHFVISADGERLSTDQCLSHTRTLNMREGSLRRSFKWRLNSGRELEILIWRMVSLEYPDLAIQGIRINRGNQDIQISIISSISHTEFRRDPSHESDPRKGSALSGRGLVEDEREYRGKKYKFSFKTAASGFSLTVGMDHTVNEGPEPIVERTPVSGELEFIFPAGKGPLEIIKYTSYIHSLDSGRNSTSAECERSLRKAKEMGHEYHITRQKEILNSFWEHSDITLEGSAELQQALRLNIFHLFQSAGRNGTTSLSAKGLTGQGYNGHYFWDTEIYALPFFIYTNPEIAKSLIDYRYSILGKAREWAEKLSHKGALFPWRTINGRETSAYFPAGTAQYHINADVVYGMEKYRNAVLEKEAVFHEGIELLIETARFWLDLGSYIPGKEGKFCIHEVTGPDEYSALVNNNLYTNMMARFNLRLASDTVTGIKTANPEEYLIIAENTDLGPDEPEKWKEAADRMYIPYNKRLGLYPQDDSFLDRPVWDFRNTPEEKYPLLLHFHPLEIYRHQVIKQADVVMALFLFSEEFNFEDKKRCFDYYEKLTTGDSSLSAAIQGIVGIELGYTDLGYEYFKKTAFTDLKDLSGNTEDGVHTASMAGSWMMVVYGFAGMRDYKGKLSFCPVLHPEIKKISFKIRFQRTLIEVEIDQTNVRYSHLEGKDICFFHYNEEIQLDNGKSLTGIINKKAWEQKI